MRNDLKTLEDVKRLLDINRNPRMSDDGKLQVRKLYLEQVELTQKVQYNDWFLSLTRAEQGEIQKFWGFSGTPD